MPTPPPEPAPAPAPVPMMAAPMRPATVPGSDGTRLSALQPSSSKVFNWTHRNHADKLAEQDKKAREASFFVGHVSSVTSLGLAL